MNTNEDTKTGVVCMVQANSSGIGSGNDANGMGGFKEATTANNHLQPFASPIWY